MHPPIGAMPSEEDQDRLRILGFSLRDVPSTDYVRYVLEDRSCGLVYASHLPIPWGIYWIDQPAAEAGLVWAKTLDDALTALARLM